MMPVAYFKIIQGKKIKNFSHILAELVNTEYITNYKSQKWLTNYKSQKWLKWKYSTDGNSLKIHQNPFLI